MDADVTFQIYKKLKPQIDSEFKDVFYNLIMPLSTTLSRVEENGVLLDIPYVDSLLEENRNRTAEIKSKFFKKVRKEFNMDSAKELREVIYDHLRIPVEEEYMTNGGKSGVKQPSTDKNAIEYLAKKHPILNGIVEYRKLEKENSTYLEGFKNHIDPVTGRVHTSFMQHSTATGRLSSTSPNTQNIPRDNRIRNMIIPREGYKLVTADLSQAELRLLAMMSNDRKMIDAFASGYDFHTYTACVMFNIDPKKFDKEKNPEHKEKRGLAKNINFGIVYQMGANSLASDVGISLKEAQDFIDKFYNTYSGVKRWIDNTKAFALKHGYVETLHGRRRYLPYLYSTDQRIREGALRQAVNTPIQGTASDCACFGLIRTQRYIDDNNLRTEPIMIIHDEIVLETPEQEIDLMVEKLPYFMTQNLPKITIPLVAEAEVLNRWKK
jgi:DNA polymerase-1